MWQWTCRHTLIDCAHAVFWFENIDTSLHVSGAVLNLRLDCRWESRSDSVVVSAEPTTSMGSVGGCFAGWGHERARCGRASKFNSVSQTQKHDAGARQAEDLWWQIGHLETVQVYALGLRWSRRFQAQASRDRERSVDWVSDHEWSFASTSSTSLDTAVLHAGIALGRFSEALVGTRRWRWRIAELAQTRALSRPLRCTKPLQHRCAPLQAARLVQRRQKLIPSPTVGWPQREWQSKASTNPSSQLLHWSVLRLRLLGDGGAAVFDVRCLLSLANTSDRTIWRDCNSDIHLWCGTKTLITCSTTRTPLKNRTTSCTDRDMGTKRMYTRHNPASAPRDRPTLRGTISLAERSICNYRVVVESGKPSVVATCWVAMFWAVIRSKAKSSSAERTILAVGMCKHWCFESDEAAWVWCHESARRCEKFKNMWCSDIFCWMGSTNWIISPTLTMFILMLGFFCPYDNPRIKKSDVQNTKN